jgi:hypothetical protein
VQVVREVSTSASVPARVSVLVMDAAGYQPREACSMLEIDHDHYTIHSIDRL